MCLDLGVEDDMIKAILEYRPDLTLRNKNGELVTEVKCEFEELTQLVLEHARNWAKENFLIHFFIRIFNASNENILYVKKKKKIINIITINIIFCVT